jgi:CheY-like chemotaxis protein
VSGMDVWEETQPGARAEARTRCSETPRPRALRILVVEDETLMAMALSDQLGDLGHEVVGVAAAAERAFQLAVERAPDVVLMDIKLSGSPDGIEAATRIRAVHPVPVIFLTGETKRPILDRARAFKPLGLLRKPYTAEELTTLLAMVPAVAQPVP